MSSSPLSVVIHSHFYQPPRDDPWWETVEAQVSAAPYHDWNERVTAECYRAVVAARIPGPQGRITNIVNTLERTSFNFGPTLLDWMEVEAPGTYRAILRADAASHQATGGHGNAMAQAYHHAILPLASRREKVSEVRWGMTDFRRRFGRDPVGMWLPETAVDDETLDVLAQEGIAFTIVAPHQVAEVPRGALPGRFRTSGGRSIALFVYDGPLSHGVAFGSLLEDAQKWIGEVAGFVAQRPPHSPPRRLVSIATDGETYGHHHPFGEMALAAVLERLGTDPRFRLDNFASFLDRNPPEEDVTLIEPSSWSCSHGVERWKSDCGCMMDSSRDWNQEWRAGLRKGMDWLAAEIHEVFEREAVPLLGDPWKARNRYGEVITASPMALAVDSPGGSPQPGTGIALIRKLAPSPLSEDEEVRALELLELERQALRLFTSCGWFFDDLARIEPLQILGYAARALELAGPDRPRLEAGFLERLRTAVSNEDPPRTGEDLFLEEVKPRLPAHFRLAAGAALWEEVEPGAVEGGPHRADARPRVPGFEAENAGPDIFRITHVRTGRCWTVETRVHRPSPATVSLAARRAGDEDAFRPVDLAELPEVYRTRCLTTIGEAVLPGGETGGASVARALASALAEAVGVLSRTVPSIPNRPSAPETEQPSLSLDQDLARIKDLADLHALLELPIPFDVQTQFFTILTEAPDSLSRQLSELRQPLGFDSSP